MSKLTRKQAAASMTAYLRYLAGRVDERLPLHEKQARIDSLTKLSRSVAKHEDLLTALEETYPEKTAAERTKLAMRLIKGLAARRELAVKQARGESCHPSARLPQHGYRHGKKKEKQAMGGLSGGVMGAAGGVNTGGAGDGNQPMGVGDGSMGAPNPLDQMLTGGAGIQSAPSYSHVMTPGGGGPATAF